MVYVVREAGIISEDCVISGEHIVEILKTDDDESLYSSVLCIIFYAYFLHRNNQERRAGSSESSTDVIQVTILFNHGAYA